MTRARMAPAMGTITVSDRLRSINQEQVLRKVLMDAPLLERPTADYIKMSRQIAALGNNLNQLAHIANASGKVSNTDLLTAKQIMEQIWRYIKGGGVQ